MNYGWYIYTTGVRKKSTNQKPKPKDDNPLKKKNKKQISRFMFGLLAINYTSKLNRTDTHKITPIPQSRIPNINFGRQL